MLGEYNVEAVFDGGNFTRDFPRRGTSGCRSAFEQMHSALPKQPQEYRREEEDLWLLNRVIRGPTSYPLGIRGRFPSGNNDLFTSRL